jgi:Asp/Glu/hydantoin racemase
VREGDPALLGGFLDGARALEAAGVRAITTSCGFLAMFQRRLAAAVNVPVFTSALQLVPVVAAMLGPGRAVGVLTVDAGALGPKHLAGAGITEDMHVVVRGLEDGTVFTRALLDNQMELDIESARRENVEAARDLTERHPEVAAIVLECTNMPPYAAAIREATGLPVFDITTLVRAVHAALVPPVY